LIYGLLFGATLYKMADVFDSSGVFRHIERQRQQTIDTSVASQCQ